ncbi:MAG: HAD-IIB family hydrolase [Chlamydiia bacterium]
MIGLLALDLDGTCVTKPDVMPERTRLFLEEAVRQGWGLFFLTGRAFGFAHQAVNALEVPFWMALQQGSLTLKMPEQTILEECTLPVSLLDSIDEIARANHLGMVVYAGFAHQDAAYVVTEGYAPEHLSHIETLRALRGEAWHEIASWTEFPADRFPLVKLFGSRESCAKAAAQLTSILNSCRAVRIKDPFHAEYDLVLITSREANKGDAILRLKQRLGQPHLLVIGAGNDNNDLTLLEVADIAIAIEGSPPALLSIADRIAGPAEQEGLLPALQWAMDRVVRGELSS